MCRLSRSDGKGTKNGPSLVDLSEAKFAQAMQDYKAGKREHKMMNTLAKKLSDGDIANLAAYYASL